MFKHLKNDLPASLVVFFVALPLCLGIALASGAPLFAGLIAGILGGIIVGIISGSSLGVSGPAAGLVVIVLNAITDLGTYESFLLAVVFAGIFQILLGIIKAGVIGYYFPSSVIKGMLAAIGVLIFFQQLQHALGYDVPDKEQGLTFYETLGFMFSSISTGVVIVTIISLCIILLWDKVLTKKHHIFKLVPGPLVAVIMGIIYQLIFGGTESVLGIQPEKLVTVPIPENFDMFIAQFTTPDFSQIGNSQIYVIAFTIAVVASLETLLCVEATDKLDPQKRYTPTNRELVAQGVGNTLSGLIGGLPITQVIVRSSANIQSGGKTKMSAIIHGFLILSTVIVIPKILNLIPLAVLAAILLVVGYKLANPKQFVEMWKYGKSQFIPFIATVAAIIITDLLMGILFGLTVGIITVLFKTYYNSHNIIEKDKDNKKLYHMNLAEEVSFINKASIQKELNGLKPNSILEIDVRKTKILDFDVVEIFDEFSIKANDKNIHIKLLSERGEVDNPESFRDYFLKNKIEKV
ncbi:MAG TPA: SulP family inorganic anion transporter [Flavobacteriaceae bacterium]|nr:SulP family inorganic anion transporter [Flavobacteriaceae bacterium]